MKKFYLSLLAGAAILGAQAGTVYNLAGTDFTVDTLYHATVGPGITETHIKVKCTLASNPYSNNLFYTTIDLRNPDIELRGIKGKDKEPAIENVLSMGNRKNAEGNGQYITGVNSDFFSMSAPTFTNGSCIVDGHLYRASDSEGWSSYAVVGDKKDIVLTEKVSIKQMATFPNGKTHSFYINPSVRKTDYLCIYTPDFGASTGTNAWGSECTMKLVSGSIDNNDAIFEITGMPVGDQSGNESHGNMAIPSDGYVLSGVNNAFALVNGLKTGDRVSLDIISKINGKEVFPRQLLGGCPLTVINGELAPDANFTRIDHLKSRQARTMIGINKDRSTLILLVDDKYTTNYLSDRQEYGVSDGFYASMLSHVMIKLGCYNVMNFDGGGSSQLYVKELGIRNIPYGMQNNYLRPVANGFFAVSTTPVDNTVASIEVLQKNVKLSTGDTFTPVVYGYNRYGVLVNKNVTDFTVTAATEIGTVNGKTLTAGSGKYSTQMVVKSGNAVCGVEVYTNGGGTFVKSGDVPETSLPYTPEDPIGENDTNLGGAKPELTEMWKYLTEDLNDGWDPTVPDWASEDAIKANSCPRFATGMDGKLYTVNMKTMSIAEITENGFADKYKLPSLEGRAFDTHAGVTTAKVVSQNPDYYGTAINRDDAGNFIIGHYFTQAESSLVWTIYSPATGKYKHFELPVPNNMAVKRLDCIGRVVGDLTKEAIVYIAPNAFVADGTHTTNQKVRILHFKGDGNIDNVTVTDSWTPLVYLAATNNWNIAQPKYATIEETLQHSLNSTFYVASCMESNGKSSSQYFGFTESGSDDWSLNWLQSAGQATTNGFDTFVLDGVRYFVRNHTEDYSANKNSMDIVVYDETGVKVASWTNPDYFSGAGYASINTEIVDPLNANIYVYNCTGKINGKDTGGAAAAVLRFSLGTYNDPEQPSEPGDVTPAGLIFDNYDDGEMFKLRAAPIADGTYPWSGATFTYRDHYPTAFDENGQLTVLLFRGQDNTVFNNQANVDAQMQKNVAVRHVSDEIGKCLVINEKWSPGESTKGWEATPINNGVAGVQPQFSFFMDPTLFENPAQKHFVRVRMVYNVLLRGCHYFMDVRDNKDLKIVKGIYATNDGNNVVPADDANVGAEYAETGINFARWKDETGNVADIPENPEVLDPAGLIDPWDSAHGLPENDPNGGRTYIMNTERFRVYEFDTYITPGDLTASVQFNIADRNITYLIKEIKFTDLGTDESAATLLGKRQLGWKYFTEGSGGVDNIVIDTPEAIDALPEYYNLQGVRVENPSSGLYIVKRGNKVTKEIIR